MYLTVFNANKEKKTDGNTRNEMDYRDYGYPTRHTFHFVINSYR